VKTLGKVSRSVRRIQLRGFMDKKKNRDVLFVIPNRETRFITFNFSEYHSAYNSVCAAYLLCI
jgi:hypothetical protein